MIAWERFDQNEWFILIMLVISYGAIWLLPKKLPTSYLVLALVWGLASATLFDFTIGGGLMDFYTVNDTDRYDLADLFTYLMFAPFGYFFIYFYEVLGINRRKLVFYVLGWAVLAMAVEWIAEWVHLTSYKHGYQPVFNLLVFLVVQTITGLYYMYLKKTQPA